MDNLSKIKEFKFVDDTELFDSKEIDILNKVKSFFSYDKKYIETLLSIINGESTISIRIIDWFVSNYSKKNNTCYKIKINNRETYFYTHIEYKNQLNGCSKKYFDPFCRKKKVKYHYMINDIDMTFITSIGQLNFFKWAISNKIIRYVTNNIQKIELDMKETARENKKKKLLQQNSNQNENSDIEIQHNNVIDREICSSDNINSMSITPKKSLSSIKSDSDKKTKRQQLSRSVYEFGIKKSYIPISLDFD